MVVVVVTAVIKLVSMSTASHVRVASHCPNV